MYSGSLQYLLVGLFQDTFLYKMIMKRELQYQPLCNLSEYMPAVTTKSLSTSYLNGRVTMTPSGQRSCHPLQQPRRILFHSSRMECMSYLWTFCSVHPEVWMPVTCLGKGGPHQAFLGTTLQCCFPGVVNLFIWEVSGVCTATSKYIRFLAITFFCNFYVYYKHYGL